jgi:peptidoglycan/LPS O-acetylase OafA/YrhL
MRTVAAVNRLPADNFDGLRLLGALAVLVCHQLIVAGRPQVELFAGSPTLAALGLAMFFGISGYLVTESWRRDPNIFRFAARRLLRLWPALAVVVCVLSLWNPGLLSNLWFVYERRLDSFFPAPLDQMNGSLWTIPVEVRCYALVALAGTASVMGWRWLAGVVAFAACIVLLMQGGLIGIQAYFAHARFPGLELCFVAGSTLSLFGRRTALAVALGLALACTIAREAEAATLVLIAFGSVLVGRGSWPVLRSGGRFGDFSYGLYLWAWPVTQLVTIMLGRESLLQLMLATLTFTFALAILSWHLIEKRALKLKPRAPAPQLRSSSSRPAVT